MNKKEYLAKRKALLDEAEILINEGKLEEYATKEQEIKDLDAKYDEIAKAQANMNALKERVTDTTIVDMVSQHGNVVDSTQTDESKDEKKEYLNAWAKYMMGRQLNNDEQVVFDKFNVELRNAAQTAATHAVLIPEIVAKGIWKDAGEMFPIIGDAKMTFVPGDFTIIKETNSGDDADWYDEETEVTDGDFATGELNLTGCELAKSVPISWKLKKMSIEEFIPYIMGLLTEKMGAALAKGIVSGKGKPGVGDTWKPQPKGIKTAIEAESSTPQIVEYSDTTGNELSYDKMAIAMGKIKSKYKTGAAIYAKSTTIWDKLALIKDNQGKPMFIPDVTLGGVGRMFGLPVKEEDSLGEGEILIGNIAKGYAVNVNENMTIYTEDHVKLRKTDYMGYAIVDGDVLTTKAFVLIKKVTT